MTVVTIRAANTPDRAVAGTGLMPSADNVAAVASSSIVSVILCRRTFVVGSLRSVLGAVRSSAVSHST